MKINKSIVYILIAGILFTIAFVLVKSTSHIHVLQVVFWRSLIVFLFSFVILKYKKIPLFEGPKKYLILRGITGCIAIICYFYTLQEMTMASAVTLQYVSPLFLVIVGFFINKERFNKIQLVFVMLALLGTAVIKNFDPTITTFQLLLGLSSAFFSALSYSFIRKLKGLADPYLVVFYFPLVTLPVILPILVMNWVTPNWEDTVKLIGVGVFSMFAQVLLTKALQRERVAKIGVIRYVDLIFAAIAGYVLFDEIISLQMVLGFILIISGVILNHIFSFKEEKSHTVD